MPSSFALPDTITATVELLASVIAEPAGQVSPSIYETGRIVSLAPWLPEHATRLEFLLDRQHPDGSWGGPGGYATVPTLSAIEALLTSALRRDPLADDENCHKRLKAAERGLAMIVRKRHDRLPDTVAVELIVPALIADVSEGLHRLRQSRPSAWNSLTRLDVAQDGDHAALARVRQRTRSGAPIPVKLLHTFEVIADSGGSGAEIPSADGAVCCSPAATAAMLSRTGSPDAAATAYLHRLIARYGGPVPSAMPITVFERAWVLRLLADAGLGAHVPRELVRHLQATIGPHGAAAGPGLPPDADTTGAVLYALSLFGAPHRSDVLWEFEGDTHFVCWQGECTPSTSTNAHVLKAFGSQVAESAPDRLRRLRAMGKISTWLVGQQRDDGSWVDKWHASPYYASCCCALALDRFGGAESARAVSRAIDWVLATQRENGSWGTWSGTGEETAYALRILLSARHTRSHPEAVIAPAIRRGRDFLPSLAGRADYPPLWHDKDLYAPTAIVAATVLAAVHLTGQERP